MSTEYSKGIPLNEQESLLSRCRKLLALVDESIVQGMDSVRLELPSSDFRRLVAAAIESLERQS